MNDTKQYFEDRVNELSDATEEGARRAFDEAARKHAPEVRRFAITVIEQIVRSSPVRITTKTN